MAASANPSGNQPEQSSFNGGAASSNPSNGNSGAGTDISATAEMMKHNPGIATNWSAEEQQILEDGLIQFASETTVVRYAKIAQNLPNKTVRDVALRCRWMNKKEISKRRKEDHTRKNKDKREKVSDPSTKTSHLSNKPVNQSYAMPLPVSLDDDGISYKAIGGVTGELLEQNAQAFQQISANFTSYQIQDNINLFCQARENIIKIMNSLKDTPEIMKQMPPLPVKLNEELANSVIPR